MVKLKFVYDLSIINHLNTLNKIQVLLQVFLKNNKKQNQQKKHTQKYSTALFSHPMLYLHRSNCFQFFQLFLLILLFSRPVLSDSLRPHGLQHTRFLCPSLSPRVCSNSCPLSWWCYPTISFSITFFSSCPESFPASGSFPVSQLFASGGQSIETLASVSSLPMNIQGWFLWRLTGLFLLSKGLSRVISSTTVWKHQFFSTLPYLWSNFHTCT